MKTDQNNQENVAAQLPSVESSDLFCLSCGQPAIQRGSTFECDDCEKAWPMDEAWIEESRWVGVATAKGTTKGTEWMHREWGRIKITSDPDGQGRISFDVVGSGAGGTMGFNHWKMLNPLQNA